MLYKVYLCFQPFHFSYNNEFKEYVFIFLVSAVLIDFYNFFNNS